jgi:transcriptional regulator with XRE-family HTH domain
VRKLTDPDKQEILKLYRESAETTSTLAERYGVSNSTISRLLKSTLPEEEYEYLVSLKRAARTPEGRANVSYDNLPLLSRIQPESEQIPDVTHPSDSSLSGTQEAELEDIPPPDRFTQPIPAIRRVKTRPSIVDNPPKPVLKDFEVVHHQPLTVANIASPMLDQDENSATTDAKVVAEIFGEDLLDEADDLDDLDEDLYGDEEDIEDEDFEEAKPLVARRRPGEAPVQVLPLSVAHLPKTCYLVIDRSAELITRPLKDFGDLGTIPSIETQQKTLPVFDNHRVAKRFSTKRDRVIKVPDTKVLHKARTHLQAKGITRLLIDGQIYSLSMF